MYYFKDNNNEVYSYSTEQLRFVPLNFIEITKEEAEKIILSKIQINA